MNSDKFFQLFPVSASTMADRVDALFYFLCLVSVVVALLIAGMIAVFAVRYRQEPGDESRPLAGVGMKPDEMKRIEVLWIGAPLVVFLVIFWWGAKLFAAIQTPPDNAMQVYVTGKQWMWKTQHLSGRREINELHVPVGTPVKLTMTSEDVIHSFYIPAFRVKSDVMPGRYTTMWFEATEVGEYHLFCAEYCGAKHSEMIGKIVVMEPRAFEVWLGGEATGSLAETGARLFTDLGCNTCHTSKKGARGPTLHGIFGKQVQLQNGDKVLVDEGYLRESILSPQKKIVAGYQPIMPTYVTQLNEEKVIELIAYIRSLEKSDALEPETVPTASAAVEPVPVPSAEGDAGGTAGGGGAGPGGGADANTGGTKGAGGEGFTP